MGSNVKRPQGSEGTRRTRGPVRTFIDSRLGYVLALLLIGVPFTSAEAAKSQADEAAVRTQRIPLTGRWEVQGNFQRARVDEAFVRADEKHLLYWLAVPSAGPEGFLATPAFAAPRILAFLITGDIGHSGSQVWAEHMADGQRLPVRANSGYFWRRVAWELPPSWQGQMIRVVATNRGSDAGSRLGISSPYTLDPASLSGADWSRLKIVPQILLALVLFLSPGLFVVLLFAERLQLPACLLPVTALSLSCLVGYGVFWIFFFSPALGRVFGTGISLIALSGLTLGLLLSDRVRQLARSVNVLFALGLWLAVVLLYQGSTLAADLGLPDSETHAYRFTDFLLGEDDELPLLLATKLYEGADPRQFFGDWRSSDRPPLQSGLVLQQMPVAAALGLPLPLYYQLLGCVLQCSWVPALWPVSRILSASRGKATVVMLCVLCTGFALLGSTYVWPKLLSAALILFAFALVLQAVLANRLLSWAETVSVGMGVALGPLAHGSAAFACLALGIFAAYFASTLGWRRLLVSLIVALGLMLPWLAYQRFYDPPGNRLLKWHLAGAIKPDNRSFSQALADNYSRSGVAGALRNKAANAMTLFAENEKELFGVYPRWGKGAEPIFVTWRRREFHQLFWALGILNIGWIVPLLALVRRRKLPRAQRLTLVFTLLGLGLWIMLMFGPGTTVIHQGPYALFLLLFALLALWIVSLPRLLAVLLISLHIGCFLTLWLFTSPANSYALANEPLIGLCLLMAAGAGALAWWFANGPALPQSPRIAGASNSRIASPG